MRAAILFVLAGLVVAGPTGCAFDREDESAPPPFADPQAGCALECHGTETSNAPPKSITGATETTAVGIGAHRQHLDPAPTWHHRIACADCHVVPAEVDSPGHIDGDGKAEVTFSMIAEPGAAWSGTTCTTRCHGNAAIGGTASVPTWTQVDGSQSRCGSCHGAPPPGPHPADPNCATCHPTMEVGSREFRDPESHINGVVDFVDANATGGCTTCHGSMDSAAPPKDLAGNTAATVPGVGAHQAHLMPSTWHRTIACSSCHQVPVTANAPGHIDGDNKAEVRFDAMNPTGVYKPANSTCSNQYCHSNGRGNSGTVSWITPGALGCGSCHSVTGANMSGAHRLHIADEQLRCSQCHGEVVNAGQMIINANLHVNGVHEVKMANGTFNATTRACSNTGCHGTKTW